jgi:hypothetical protein
MKTCSVKITVSKLVSLEFANTNSKINQDERSVDRDCKPFVSQQNEYDSYMYSL